MPFNLVAGVACGSRNLGASDSCECRWARSLAQLRHNQSESDFQGLLLLVSGSVELGHWLRGSLLSLDPV